MGTVKSPGLAPPTIDHYENFPVASWLCPPRLRPCIAAIYGFARTADDLADEGDSEPSQRLDALERYRIDLNAVAQDARAPTDHPGVFAPLGQAIREFSLPLSLLRDLLDAFEQDVRMSARGAWYANRAELLDYCRRSANPIGRLLLHLYGVSDPRSLAQSDAVCSALQLINFWQDLSVDIPRGRYYLPLDAIQASGVTETQVMTRVPSPALAALLQDQTAWARTLMLSGAPLPLSLPGRVGWELRLVVQGGLRTLGKVQALGALAFRTRPRLTALDLLPMAWHSLRMRRQAPAAILPA